MEVPVVDVSCLNGLCRDHRIRRDLSPTTPYTIADVQTAIRTHLSRNEGGNSAEDISPEVRQCATSLLKAFKEVGFAYIRNYALEASLEVELDSIARKYFTTPHEAKMEMQMAKGGRAWRGFFPVGGELTNGKPDVKEGIYFGQDATDAQLSRDGKATLPLHGANLYPGGATDQRQLQSQWRSAVREYMTCCEAIGQGLMVLLAIALDLPGGPSHFLQMGLTHDPLGLFRIFHYPPPHMLPSSLLDRINAAGAGDALWGVGEHTDYGLLTLLRQDDVGGLQVRSRAVKGWGWIDAPPKEGTLVVNVGDMLEALTQGLLMSTPHRVVRNPRPANSKAQGMRISMPYFFDPSFSFIIKDVELSAEQRREAGRIVEEKRASGHRRWDAKVGEGHYGVADIVGSSKGGKDLTYGEYLSGKVSKVFPELAMNGKL